MEQAKADPVASIVIATYNRPKVLDYAIRSVRQSTFTDWELIVVGDGCTDETADVVMSYADPRISWLNLPENTGNQAAPNNAGIARARGRYLLFLNHDDLWFAGHLREMIEALETSGADIVFSPVALLAHSGRATGPPDSRVDRIQLDGLSPGGYSPRTFVIASSWALRRDVVDVVGPWKPPGATRLSPSQEWLYRAARRGCRIDYHPHVSVLCIHAGVRRLSYLIPSPEHDRAWEWVRDQVAPGRDLLETIAIQASGDLAARPAPRSRRNVTDRLRALLTRISERFGVHPDAADRFLRGQRRGSWIADVHSTTFDAPPLGPDEQVTFGNEAGAPYLIRGWHRSDPGCVWSSEETSILAFAVAEDARPESVEITGGPLVLPSEVTFSVPGQPDRSHRYEHSDETVRLDLAAGQATVAISITVPRLSTPAAVGRGPDERHLGFGLISLRLIAEDAP